MTTLYLGFGSSGAQIESLMAVEKPDRPAILVSYLYLKLFRKAAAGYEAKMKNNKMFLDSGAYTAMTMGKAVDIDGLIKEGLEGGWDECAALDVVGDPEKGLANARYMKGKGSKAFPTFHFGEPWHYLESMCKEFDKVGLGGIVPIKSTPDRMAWLDEVFARAYPKKFHLFGWLAEDPLMKYPFHSADSCGWEMGPACFGTYQFAGGQNLGMRRKTVVEKVGLTYMKPEVEVLMRLQRKVRARWAVEFKKRGWA